MNTEENEKEFASICKKLKPEQINELFEMMLNFFDENQKAKKAHSSEHPEGTESRRPA